MPELPLRHQTSNKQTNKQTQTVDLRTRRLAEIREIKDYFLPRGGGGGGGLWF